MKKFLRHCFIFFLIVSSIMIIIPILIVGGDMDSQAFLMSEVDKERILDSTKGNRLILIGGSNVAFGFNSQILKDSLKIEPVNMGLHAGIGLDYMFRTLKNKVRKGDFVVIMPEYHQFSNTFYGSDPLFEMLLRRGDYIQAFKLMSKWYVGIKLVAKDIERELSETKVYPEIYVRNKFNKYGDYTGHWNLPSKQFNHNGFDKIVKENIGTYKNLAR